MHWVGALKNAQIELRVNMNDAHWHLVVNHLPIVFPIVGVIVMIAGAASRSEAVKRAAYMIFTIGALLALAAMNTGEGAEDVVEKISGVNESYIESHEESAELFSVLCYLLGGISLLGLWASFMQKTFSNIIGIGTLLFALVVLFFGKETGTTGGEIRHTEIRSGNSVPDIDSYNIEKEDYD
jgi:uncharacterized membrane protein